MNNYYVHNIYKLKWIVKQLKTAYYIVDTVFYTQMSKVAIFN